MVEQAQAVKEEAEREVTVHIPEIKVRWLRSQDYIPFTRPNTYLNLGMRGSGKSSLLEVLAIRYPKIIDLFASSDNESLCWCKPEFIEFFKGLYGREPRILLIVGKDMDVASRWNKVKVTELKLSDFEAHDIITTAHAFYSNETNLFAGLHKVTSLLWEKRTYWREAWFVLIREASNWIYARLKMTRNDMMAKADFIKALREARHHGLAVGVDTIRWTSLDKEVRDVSDYIFLKRVGAIGLPDDLRWMYRYVRPYSMMQAKPGAFMLVTGRGAVGFGRFDYPPWHKEERENILWTTNIEVKRVKDRLPEDRRYGIGDTGHSEIVIEYIKTKSMRKVVDTLGNCSLRSVSNHIHQHNKLVEMKGVCPKCHHAGSEFESEHIVVQRFKHKSIANHERRHSKEADRILEDAGLR